MTPVLQTVVGLAIPFVGTALAQPQCFFSNPIFRPGCKRFCWALLPA